MLKAIWSGVVYVGRRIAWIGKKSGNFLDQHTGSITALATVMIAVLTIFYVVYSKGQWETMRESLAVTQRSYITIGRKDGVIADVIIPKDPKSKAGIVIYFQNSGHTPAKFNWAPLMVTSLPPPSPISLLHQWHPMIRSRNKKTGHVTQNGSSLTISGASIYVADLGELSTESAVAMPDDPHRLLQIMGRYEYCDELGTYSSRDFVLFYQSSPFNAFRLAMEYDSPFNTRTPYPADPDMDYLPACENSKERQSRQQENDRRVGDIIRSKGAPKN